MRTVGVLRARQIVPNGIERLTIPPGIDRTTFLLGLPAFMPEFIPPGADRSMTLDGPDQMYYLFVAILCIAAPCIFLMVRIYTKTVVVRSLELADYFIILAFPLIISEVVMGYFMVKWGAGVHQWQVTLDQLFHQLYWANLGQVIYCPISFLVKMAILLQYLRLFAPSRSVNRVMWYGAWATMISCAILYTILMFWTMFYCSPRPAIWNKLTPNAKCHDVNHIIVAQGAFNMGSDIIILLLPTTSLWRLNVPLGRKIAVTALFATGLLACAASAMRIVYTVKIAPVIAEADVSHNGLFIGLWTEAEVSLGFIVACALCLPKLVQAKGHRLKRAISKASSPFFSRGAVHSTSPRDFTLSEPSLEYKDASSRESTHRQADASQMQGVQAASGRMSYHQRPLYHPIPTQAGHLHPGTYAASIAVGSSVYSQSPVPSRHSSRARSVTRDSSDRVAPLRVSIYGRDGRYLGARSPARQLAGNGGHMSMNAEEAPPLQTYDNEEERKATNWSVAIPIPLKSPRRPSRPATEDQDYSGFEFAPNDTRGTTAVRPNETVYVLQPYNSERKY